MSQDPKTLKNYATCPIEQFYKAMNMARRDVDPTTIPDAELFILYTKYQADAQHLALVGQTSYARGLGILSQRKADMYKTELGRRGIPLRAT